ncbi:hypothetical protein HD806DRAFT_482242 [Xylariaceae sp. AK1471]|nr:hypothetical protein HD806DRAFT_482242 [Xylariaceae sp. AK1471]
MVCGLKWGTCACPWFTYDLEEEDEPDHMNIHVPMVSRERLGGSDPLPWGPHPGLSYMHGSRHRQGQRHEERARRLQHADANNDDDDDDDDYLDDLDDGVGIGNAAGHILNADYRRRSHSTVVPPVAPPAVPLPPPSAAPERAKSGTNYVSGVKKARGMRGSSMERRLADRFSGQRQASIPTHHSFGPPPPAHPLGMGFGAPMLPSPISRRHTMDDDMYDVPINPFFPGHPLPRRATHDYMDDFALHPASSRRRYRDMEPPRPSELAGLTGPGSGMNRVYEWRNHVDPLGPEAQSVR